MKAAFYGLVAFLLFSCSETGLMNLDLKTEPKESLIMRTIDPGEVLSSDTSIPLVLTNTDPSVTIDSVQLSLLNSKGIVVKKYLFTPEILTGRGVPAFSLASLDPGTLTADQALTVRLEAFSGKKSQKVKEIPVFFSDHSWSGLLVGSHPQEIYPSSTAILEASFDSPSPQAFIRWKQGDKLLKEGTFASGAAVLKWKSPAVEGLYTLTADIYPVAPPPGQTYSFKPKTSLPIRLVVTKIESYEPKELKADENYLTLFHFRGNLRDSGAVKKGALPDQTIGVPEPDLYKGLFGYDFSGLAGVENRFFALPLNADGQLQPFSINARFMLRAGNQGAEILRFEENSTGLQAALTASAAGILSFKVSLNGQQAESKLTQPIDTANVQLLTLSVLPLPDQLDFLWYLNGYLIKQEYLSFRLPERLSTLGLTRIGGETQGIPGIVDEIGVYFQDEAKRPGIDNSGYNRAMVEKYGSELEYAEGFDGLYLSPDLESSGKLALKDGQVTLGPGAQLRLPVIFPGAPSWKAKISRNEVGPGLVSLYYEGEKTPLLTIDLAGSFSYAGGTHPFTFDKPSLDLNLKFNDQVIVCRFGDQELALTPTRNNAGLRWVLSQKDDAKTNFSVADFLILKDFTEKKSISSSDKSQKN